MGQEAAGPGPVPSPHARSLHRGQRCEASAFARWEAASTAAHTGPLRALGVPVSICKHPSKSPGTDTCAPGPPHPGPGCSCPRSGHCAGRTSHGQPCLRRRSSLAGYPQGSLASFPPGTAASRAAFIFPATLTHRDLAGLQAAGSPARAARRGA